MKDYEKMYKEALEAAKSGKPIEDVFPELVESEDEGIRNRIIGYLKQDIEEHPERKERIEDMLAWLERQGEFKSSKWAEGDVVRHGGVLALVINGRKAMKSNCEQITIQYPDEWVKAETKERKYFFEELEKQGEWKQEIKLIFPKFRVGDRIFKTHNSDINKCGIFTITKITEQGYWYNDSVICAINEEDGWELEKRQPAELSEEDKLWIDRACMLLNELNDLSNLTLAKIPSNVNEIIEHLKSLRPQKQWKPTEEQMDALDMAILEIWSNQDSDKLMLLYQDLKRLI